LKNKFSILNSFSCFCGIVYELEKGWNWFDMGFGNYLMVRDIFYNDCLKYIKENFTEKYDSGELYKKWYDMIKIVMEDKYFNN